MKDELIRNINIASGRKKASFVIKNAKVVNVFTQELLEADIAIENDKIVGVGSYNGHNELDAHGHIVSPSFIDAHVHIESSMVTAPQLAQCVVPAGTTSIIADPHEIANVKGLKGIQYILDSSKDLPFDVFVMLPSCVPATSFEHSGASLSADDLKTLIQNPRVLGLGEMMDYPSLINADPYVLDKIVLALTENKLIDGHSPGISGRDLNAYRVAGITSDHECSSLEEMQNRLQLGMYVLIREGSAAKNLTTLIKGVNSKNSRRCLFCTDDRQPEDILKYGHIDNNIRLAVSEGLDPITAIQMASLNAAEAYRLHDRGAIAPGYTADIALLDNLRDLNVLKVFKNGTLVADNKKALFSGSSFHDKDIFESVHVKELSEASFKLHLKGDLVNVIHIHPGSLVTEKAVRKVFLNEKKQYIHHEKLKLQKLAVIERHNATGNIGLGLVENFSLNNGAIATSIAHDSHNLIVIGDNDSDMLAACQELIKIQGGISIASQGAILDSLPLPIAGLMTDKKVEWVNEKLKTMLKIAQKQLGVNPQIDPFMTLAFLALPVIPELKLTDMGLFDVSSFSFIDINA